MDALLDELHPPPPTTLVVEDVHWADEATVDTLRFLIRRIVQLPVVLLLTYRDDELSRDHPLTHGTAAQYAGRWCWRFIADGWDGDEDTWHARLAPGRSLVTVPLGEGAVFCYADIASGNGRPPGDWRSHFDEFGGPTSDLLGQGGHAYATPITEVDQPYAFLGRTVLIGDAAHAMSPSMAQGVGLALEDALVLAETLSSLPVREALPAYEEQRAPRIAWVRAQTHRRDSARGLTPAVRDRVVRLTGRRMVLAGQRTLLAMP